MIYLIITGITYRHFPSYDSVLVHNLYFRGMRENTPMVVDEQQ